jgi:hypothetical protein
MDLQRHNRLGTDGFEQLRDVSRGHWIMRFGAAIFAGVTQIGRHNGHARGASIPERTDEKQEPAQLVIGAFARSSVQALQNIDVSVADDIKRPDLVLAVLEIPLLMCGERLAENTGNGLAELGGRRRSEDPQPLLRHRSLLRHAFIKLREPTCIKRARQSPCGAV